MHSSAADQEPLPFATKETYFSISGPGGRLQVASRAASSVPGKAVAIICHPHPLHGGTMENKVVTTLARAYRESGIDVLRFNFRGVGESEGHYGELDGEIEDLRAVVRLVQRQRPGAAIYLAGFSFGSAVAAQVARQDGRFKHLLLVAPPVGKYDLSFPDSLDCPTLVLQGDQDDVVDLRQTRQWAQGRSGSSFAYREMAGAGHFFHGRLTELRELATAGLQAAPGGDRK